MMHHLIKYIHQLHKQRKNLRTSFSILFFFRTNNKNETVPTNVVDFGKIEEKKEREIFIASNQ